VRAKWSRALKPALGATDIDDPYRVGGEPLLEPFLLVHKSGE
jgi:hypothetical protein